MYTVTTYLSFRAQRPARDSEADARKWHDHFLKDAHQYNLDDNNVDGLMKTLVLGQDLKLPLKLTFKTSHVGELLAPVKASTIRPFHHQRYVQYHALMNCVVISFMLLLSSGTHYLLLSNVSSALFQNKISYSTF